MKEPIYIYDKKYQKLILESENYSIKENRVACLSFVLMEDNPGIQVGMLVRRGKENSIPYYIHLIIEKEPAETHIVCNHVARDFTHRLCEMPGILDAPPREHLEHILERMPEWKVGSTAYEKKISVNYPVWDNCEFRTVFNHLETFIARLNETQAPRSFKYDYHACPGEKFTIDLIEQQTEEHDDEPIF